SWPGRACSARSGRACRVPPEARGCAASGSSRGGGRRSSAVELHTDPDRRATARRPVRIGVTQRIHAAAVLLLVELLPLADLDHALGAALLAPVVLPVHEARIARRGPHAAVVDLRHVLPARDAERAGDDGKAVLVGVERRALEAHVEAHGAAPAALGLVLHAAGAGEPLVLVVVGIDELDAVLLGERDVLALSDLVLRARMDVRVVEEDRVLDARFEHRFHDLAGARGAAGVQQHPRARNRRLELLALGQVLAVAHGMLGAWGRPAWPAATAGIVRRPTGAGDRGPGHPGPRHGLARRGRSSGSPVPASAVAVPVVRPTLGRPGAAAIVMARLRVRVRAGPMLDAMDMAPAMMLAHPALLHEVDGLPTGGVAVAVLAPVLLVAGRHVEVDRAPHLGVARRCD